MTYGDKIKELCKKKGVSVSRLEKDLGFGNNYIARLEDKIPTNRAIMIAEYFGLPSDYFLPEAIKKESTPVNPLLEQIMIKASTLSDKELEELLSFAGYIQSKH